MERIDKNGNHPKIPGEDPITIPSLPASELLTIAEVAAYLKLSRRTAWRWCKSGHLPAVKVGHQWRVSSRDLENFIHQRGK